jgi:RNA-directed DNA polymerase
MTRTVRRLQARIVQAIQARRWGKVQALQHLLTHSFSAKALAVRRVTENPGKRTPGVDRVLWHTPEKKAAAISTLRQRGYRAQPMRRVLIPKPNGKMRPLGIATVRDRAMQALYLFALDPDCRNDRGSELVRVPSATLHGGCDRTMSLDIESQNLGAVGVGGRHPIMFR